MDVKQKRKKIMKTLNCYNIGRGVLLMALLAGQVSCRQQESLVVEPSSNQVQLVPEVLSKGAVVTTDNISSFKAFGYAHGHQLWDAVKTTAKPDLMFDNLYTKSGTAWAGETPTEWPNDELKRYSFFAYSPVASSGNNITLNTTATTAGYPKLNYETLADVGSQVDLVLASRLNQTPINEVPLSFAHALARVGFIAYTDKPGVTVKSISINGVKYKGHVEVRGDGVWSSTADKGNFTATINSSEISTTEDTLTDLRGDHGEHYFMLIPQDLSTNTDNSVCITVVSVKDGRDKSASYTIKQNYEQGKSLLYKLFIRNNVDLDVTWTVTDWTTIDIPTPLPATYLNISSIVESGDVTTVFYGTDCTDAVTITEMGSTGKLSFSQNVIQKSFTITCRTAGTYYADITADKLIRHMTITR